MTARAGTWASYGLVLLLTALLAVWGSFLVPLRLGATPLPVSWLVAAIGNAALVRWAGQLLGRRAAVVPILLWLAIALTLGSKRAEGDLVVPGTLPGLVFLLVGAVAGAVGYGASPAGGPRRSDERGDL